MPTVTDILNTAAPIAAAIRALGGTIIEVTVVPNHLSELDTHIVRIGVDLRGTMAPPLSEIGEALGASVQWAIRESYEDRSDDAVILRKDDTIIHIGQAVDPGQYLIPAIDIISAAQLIASLGSIDTLHAFVVEYEDSEYDDDEDTSVHVHVVPTAGTDPAVFTPAWLVTDEIRVTVKAAL